MVYLDREPIVERIIHRLVRKHIAGTTMESALDAAKELNGKNLSVSLTFLSANATEKAKAKYITTTYSELVRRVARMGIKAGVHVGLDQLGSAIGMEFAMDNFREIWNVSSKYGVFLWLDADGLPAAGLSHVPKMNGVGLVVRHDRAGEYAKIGEEIGHVKLAFRDYSSKEKNGIVKIVETARKSMRGLVLCDVPEGEISGILRSKIKSEVGLEFGYGYSEKKMAAALKRGAKVSVLVPFGKDWIKYAMNNAPEGYMRFVAGRLLKEGELDDA